jgi:hypothetical protein
VAFLETLIPALAKATTEVDVDAVLAAHPSDIRVEPTATSWKLSFAAVDVGALLAAWGWTDMVAVSGDVAQQSFELARSTGAIAADRIATVTPTTGVWAIALAMKRPAGAMPKQVAGASPAYDLAHYTATTERIEIRRAPRPHAPTIATLRALCEKPPIAMTAIAGALGRPDRNGGSGIYILTYYLDDGSVIKVGTADRLAVMYIRLAVGRNETVLYSSGP